jgi:3-oxoacyl-[acyl-carrier protein] reductase
MDFMETFRGKTAVITGAASGMGLAASRILASAGAKVVMCDVDSQALEKAAAEIAADGRGCAMPCTADVRRFADAEMAAEAAVRETGRLDLYIGFAGGYEPRMCGSFVPFYEQPVEVIDWGIDVNLMGQIYFARACMPQMVRQKSGVICCIGSVTGFEGDGTGAMYGTAKSGLFNFVKGLAQAGAPHGVRAFCVTPGPVMTRPGMAGLKTLQGHASQPQELVDFVLYLASDRCPSVTGSNHVMDCGRLSMQPQ